MDEVNELSQLWFARSKDTPAKMWWYADLWHPATGRALNMDRSEFAGVYALAPFRLARIDEKVLVLAAYPAPRIFDPIDEDWLGIDAVIAWNPVDDTATVLGDVEPQLVGSFHEDSSLFASPRAFFQRWAQKRAAYAVQRQMVAGKDWHHPPIEGDLVPGALIIGKPSEIRWTNFDLPRDLEVVGISALAVNRAILRSARVPRAFERAA